MPQCNICMNYYDGDHCPYCSNQEQTATVQKSIPVPLPMEATNHEKHHYTDQAENNTFVSPREASISVNNSEKINEETIHKTQVINADNTGEKSVTATIEVETQEDKTNPQPVNNAVPVIGEQQKKQIMEMQAEIHALDTRLQDLSNNVTSFKNTIFSEKKSTNDRITALQDQLDEIDEIIATRNKQLETLENRLKNVDLTAIKTLSLEPRVSTQDNALSIPIKNLLPIIDSLYRGKLAYQEKLEKIEFKEFVTQLTALLDQLTDILGIYLIIPQTGEPVNNEIHLPLEKEPSLYALNAITQVIRPGIVYKNQKIRLAEVIISTGEQKQKLKLEQKQANKKNKKKKFILF